MAEKQSLARVTQGFIALLIESREAEVDLVAAEQQLKTTKRRLYDVVNILAGVGLVVRTGKARVRWAQAGAGPPRGAAALAERERQLDAMLGQVEADLLEISRSELFQKFAWIDPADAIACLVGRTGTAYALTGPPSMTIVLDRDGDGDGAESRGILCSVPSPSDGGIRFAPIEA
jgi:hypothetical protein